MLRTDFSSSRNHLCLSGVNARYTQFQQGTKAHKAAEESEEESEFEEDQTAHGNESIAQDETLKPNTIKTEC